ncbi:helix-turn-helix transcriptional regulator [Paenibacillus albidus]|uniref:helix-turn-helix domain-containing protein n=1 Tax=Paenibacillus albidus TaxID=2041023 RepID=UPI001BECAB3F|nr:AraC family transcriptional regulator [Paenibacillus albidus]MBT2288820.1 helix-turn-helix transcriptional regulator [Paenibacillus albidus]
MDTVAENVQRSSSYLSRIFKESTGMTINDYLIQLRIKRAMELLQQLDLSTEEICREIGYANADRAYSRTIPAAASGGQTAANKRNGYRLLKTVSVPILPFLNL